MIETVRGAVPADALGVVCMHDHVLADSSGLQRTGAPPGPVHEGVAIDTLGYLRWNMLASADNLRLDDPELAARELSRARHAGQRTVVECSAWGLGPHHAALPAVSAAADIHIVCAYGAYVPRTVPGWITQLDEAELEEHFVAALDVAIPGTAFRAGMLGIMGTTGELEEREREQLRAAARAAVRTGAALSVRLEPDALRGIEVLDLLAQQALPSDRVVFTNADEYLDRAYWADLAAAGAVLEMCFGTEAMHVGRVDNPSDRERLAFFPEFTRDHPRARLVLGQSVWTKAQLAAYGGYGYGYLMERVLPALRDAGVGEERLEDMLVIEPRRLLDRDVRRASAPAVL